MSNIEHRGHTIRRNSASSSQWQAYCWAGANHVLQYAPTVAIARAKIDQAERQPDAGAYQWERHGKLDALPLSRAIAEVAS